jgi:nucleoside-diphosphate-sugar epimerase
MTERFLVTGGQGPLGAWVVRLLLLEGADLVLCDPTPASRVLPLLVEPERLAGLKRIFTATADPGRFSRLLERERITRVLHLDGGAASSPAQDRSTEAVLEAARAAGSQVRLTVHLAGDGTPERPLIEAQGPPSIGVRLPALYGVGQEGPATLAIRAAALARRYTIPFTGAVCLAYAGDAARTVVALARSEPRGALVLQLPGEAVSVSELIARVEEAVPEAAGLLRAAGEEASVAPLLDDGGLLDLLGGEGLPAPTPLVEGIRRTAEMFRALAEEGRLPEGA